MFKDYITELDTKIVKRKYVGDLTHLALEDNIVLEYEKLNIEREDIFINGHKVNDIYNSSLGFVLVSQLKPHTSDVKIRVDFDKRLAILKSLSSRLLIESV